MTIYIEFQHNWGVDTILQEKKSQDGIAKEYLKDGILLSIMWTNRDASYLILFLIHNFLLAPLFLGKPNSHQNKRNKAFYRSIDWCSGTGYHSRGDLQGHNNIRIIV